MSSNERASKFCQELYHKLGLYVDKQRDNGVSDRAIFRKLEEMESCGISCEGWKKRIEHRDTCTHLGVEPHRLSQTETRKLRRLNKRDKKRVKQAFEDRLKNNGELSPKETRRVFKQAFNKVDPIVLKKRRVVPQTTEISAENLSLGSVSPPLGDSNPNTISARDLSKVQRLEEQPPDSPVIAKVPFLWKTWKPTEVRDGVVDPSRFKHSRFPKQCICAYCTAVLGCQFGIKPTKGVSQ